MCRAGGPRCSDKWSPSRKLAESFKRKMKRKGFSSEDFKGIADIISSSDYKVNGKVDDTKVKDLSSSFPPTSEIESLIKKYSLEDDEDHMDCSEYRGFSVNEIDSDSKGSIETYSGLAFFGINGYLRGQTLTKTHPLFLKKKEFLLSMPKVVAGIDSSICRFEKDSHEPLLLYRGAFYEDKSPEDTIARFKKGSILFDRAYSSTSSNPDIAFSFSKPQYDSGSHVLMRILTPNGMPIGDISSLSFEREHLISRGRQFAVSSAKKEKIKGRDVVVVDLIDMDMVREEDHV